MNLKPKSADIFYESGNASNDIVEIISSISITD